MRKESHPKHFTATNFFTSIINVNIVTILMCCHAKSFKESHPFIIIIITIFSSQYKYISSLNVWNTQKEK